MVIPKDTPWYPWGVQERRKIKNSRVESDLYPTRLLIRIVSSSTRFLSLSQPPSISTTLYSPLGLSPVFYHLHTRPLPERYRFSGFDEANLSRLFYFLRVYPLATSKLPLSLWSRGQPFKRDFPTGSLYSSDRVADDHSLWYTRDRHRTQRVK